MKRYHVLLDLPISDISVEQACLLAQNRPPNAISVWLMADTAQVLRCARQTRVLDACLACDRILAQGQSVRVAAAGLGQTFTEKAFSACDLLCALMASGQGRYFFIGGKSGLARRAAVATAGRAGRVPCPVVGGVCGDFCRKGRENAAVLTRLWECQPDTVLLSMDDGALWLADNRSKLPPALYILVPAGVMAELAGCEEAAVPFARWREFFCRSELCRRERVRRNKMKRMARKREKRLV